MIATWIVPVVLLALPRSGESRLNGTYTLQADRGDPVPSAVASAVAGMNFVLRPIARRRLEHTNRPARELSLSLGAEGHEVRFDARAPIRTPADGRAIPWTREDGERFMVRASLGDRELVQSFEAADGAKTLRYQLDPDGLQLRLNVTVESPKLPEPLNYTLVYRRKHP